MTDKIIKSDKEWQQLLTKAQYKITRQKGTEKAFSGKYWDFKEDGIYQCVCCDNEVFSSETKFDSGTGWPSFREPVSEQNIGKVPDTTLSMTRTEKTCRTAGLLITALKFTVNFMRQKTGIVE